MFVLQTYAIYWYSCEPNPYTPQTSVKKVTIEIHMDAPWQGKVKSKLKAKHFIFTFHFTLPFENASLNLYPLTDVLPFTLPSCRGATFT